MSTLNDCVYFRALRLRNPINAARLESQERNGTPLATLTARARKWYEMDKAERLSNVL